MGVCPNCGESLVEGALFCEKCGAKIGVVAPAYKPSAAPTYKPAWKKPSVKFGGFKPGKMMTVSIILVVAIIVLAGTMVAVVAPLMTEPKITQTTTVAEYVMSCAYKNYAKEELGFYVAKTMIQNKGSVPVTDYKIYYKITGYTDWCPVHQYKEIVPGQTVVDHYYPSLPATVLQLTTETTVPLEVKWEYKSLSGKTYSDTSSDSLKILGRNEFVHSSLPDSEMLGPSDWFSNRDLVVCFVTKNELVLDSFADNCTAGLNTATSDEDALKAFVNAFYALRDHGVGYNQVGSSVWDPHFTQDIKYPKDVINQKAGTCIELAICIAAIMESVGIKSYIYLIPGHAIPAIALPNSGTLYPIESTFIDKDYAWGHYQQDVTQSTPEGQNPSDVTAEACINSAISQINQNYKYAWVLPVDVEAAWQSGIVPPE